MKSPALQQPQLEKVQELGKKFLDYLVQLGRARWNIKVPAGGSLSLRRLDFYSTPTERAANGIPFRKGRNFSFLTEGERRREVGSLLNEVIKWAASLLEPLEARRLRRWWRAARPAIISMALGEPVDPPPPPPPSVIHSLSKELGDLRWILEEAGDPPPQGVPLSSLMEAAEEEDILLLQFLEE